MNNLVVVKISKDGSSQNVSMSAAQQRIDAVSDVNYLVINEQTEKSPQKLEIMRKEDDLLIQSGDESLIISDYYVVENVDVIGYQDGMYFSYGNNATGQVSPIESLLSDQVSVQTLGGESHQTAWWSTGGSGTTIGAGALLGGLGIAAAVAGGGGSANSSTSDSSDDEPTGMTLSNNLFSENSDGAFIGLLSMAGSEKDDIYTYTLNNHNDKFEIVDGVLKVKEGFTFDFDTISPAPDAKYPTVRWPYAYELNITATDSSQKSVSKKLTVKLNNEYEAADDPGELPYFIAPLYEKDIIYHAATPHGWGNPGTLNGETDWTDYKKIIGQGRTIVWGFGDPNHKDNTHEEQQAYTNDQKDGIRKAMNYYEELFDINIDEETVTDTNYNDKDNEFDIVFYRAKLDNGTLGYTHLNPSDAVGGAKTSNNIFMSTNSQSGYPDTDTMQSGDSYLTLLHEIGHAVGLDHVGPTGEPSSPPFLPENEEHQGNTVMSYNGDRDNPGSFNNELAMYDKAMLEYMYGLNDNYKSGNTVHVYDNNVHYVADGSGDNDTLDVSGVQESTYINLTPGSWCYVEEQKGSILDDGQFFIGYDTQIENVITGGGNDTVIGGTSKHSEISTGVGDDVINVGGAETTTIHSGSGNDAIKGGAGNDLIYGDSGNDVVYGGGGSDVMYGGEGTDILTGGAGNDTFVFDTALGNDNIDTIADFSVGDILQLDDNIFTSLKDKSGSEIMDYITYDSTNGELLYDSDANGATAPVHFATLQTGLSLDETNFGIV